MSSYYGYKFVARDDEGRAISQWYEPWNKSGDTVWKVGKTNTVDPPKKTCVGLNCCRYIGQAWSWYMRRHGAGNVVLVKVRAFGKRITAQGESLSASKITAQKMTAIKMWEIPFEVWDEAAERCSNTNFYDENDNWMQPKDIEEVLKKEHQFLEELLCRPEYEVQK